MTQEGSKRNLPSLILVVITVLLVVSGLWLLSTGAAQKPDDDQDAGTVGLHQYSWLDRSWAAVTFEAKATPEQLAKLRPTYQRAWDARAEALKRAEAQREQKVYPKVFPKVEPGGVAYPKVEAQPGELKVKGDFLKGELKWNKALGPESLPAVLEGIRKEIQAQVQEVLTDEQFRAYRLSVRELPPAVTG